MRRLQKIFYTLTSAGLMLPYHAWAQSKLGQLFDRAGSLLKTLISFFFVLATAAFLFGIVKYLVALREGKEPTEAKNYMFWGIIGLFLILSFWGIVYIVSTSLFG